MEIKWSIDKVVWDKSNNNSIRTVDYTVTATENGESASISQSACLRQATEITDSFVPLEQVTEEQVIQWVKQARHPNEESLTFFEDGLKSMLTQKTNQGLPWA